MGSYLSPGVYVEEVPPLARPIAGVGTSTPGFIGIIPDKIYLPSRKIQNEKEAYRWIEYNVPSEVNEPYKITSWNQYTKLFGDFIGGNTDPEKEKKIEIEGTGTEEKKYITGTTDPYLTVFVSWGESGSKTGMANASGNYKIEIDSGITEVKVTTSYPTDSSADPRKKEEIITEGTRKEAKIFVTGTSIPLSEVSINWNKSQSKSEISEETGKYKIEIDPEITEVKVTTSISINSIDNSADSKINVRIVTEDEGKAAKKYVTGITSPLSEVSVTWGKSDPKTEMADASGNYKIELDPEITEVKVTTSISINSTDNSADSKKNVRIVTVGEGKAAKKYVTGTTSSSSEVSVAWNKSFSKTGRADASGHYKIEIDPEATEISNRKITLVNIDINQNRLAHAVYGFFNNGGSSCYVARISTAADLRTALDKLVAVEDITMVAAPGLSSASEYTSLIDHAELLKDRVSILDAPENVDLSGLPKSLPKNSTYAAFYFPWIQVSDPATSLIQSNVKGDGLIYVPPSGHIAGLYAKSDNTYGVFKAPANEPPLNGVTGLKHTVSKSDQEGLNGVGVNMIRHLTGGFRVWGARTVGGDANGEYRYISTRRYFNYLRESIDRGTQFVVFEPNSPVLWERIKRTIEDFLLREWRSGALFGTTPKDAFFIKCDASTNPSEVREAGQVVTEISVAIVKPAEFVIFRIQQTTGG